MELGLEIEAPQIAPELVKGRLFISASSRLTSRAAAEPSLTTRNKAPEPHKFVTIIPPHKPRKMPYSLAISTHYGNMSAGFGLGTTQQKGKRYGIQKTLE